VLHFAALLIPLYALFQSNASSRIDAGPIKLEIYISETATLFHVVDQLSQWSEFSHEQYRRYFRSTQGELSDGERSMLAEHSAIRTKYGWGRGPEKAFYTPLALSDALTAAVNCAPIQTCCSGECFNTTSDAKNCGVCGKHASAGGFVSTASASLVNRDLPMRWRLCRLEVERRELRRLR
jgi:hypothetical protein